ncbi:MAG: SAM-dependent methyltransferase [Sphingobium sp.]|nr:SAM-dependent methyltransferase [Sphingobium sp.]
MPRPSSPARRRAEPATPPPGFPARRAALRLLDAVIRRGQPLETALHGAAQGLPPSDRALVHAIAAGTLRHLRDLDALIDGATRQPLPDDAKARMVLRLALAQALLLETAPHAVIATALPLVDGGPRKLVHGVLGTLLREGATLPDPPSLPAEVEARWSASWGEAMVDAARRAIAVRPPLDLSLRDAAMTAEMAERLGGVSLAPGHVRLPAETDVTALEGFADGAFWVQDLAASLPARLLGQGEGRSVLDLCAAPGGKTMQLAAAGWRVTSVDQSAKRLERLEETVARTGLSTGIQCADLRSWTPAEPADAILLDAPCSATGIFRRHPDVLHRVGPRQIAEMAELQAELLDRVAGWLRPGGRLVYATCSLEPAEGEDQVAALLERHKGLRPCPIDMTPLPQGLVGGTAGQLRTLPGMLAEAGGLDGFFIASLEHD